MRRHKHLRSPAAPTPEERRDRAQPVGSRVRPGQHPQNTGTSQRRRNINPGDFRMGKGRAHEHHRGHALHRDVGGVATLAPQESRIFIPPLELDWIGHGGAVPALHILFMVSSLYYSEVDTSYCNFSKNCNSSSLLSKTLGVVDSLSKKSSYMVCERTFGRNGSQYLGIG